MMRASPIDDNYPTCAQTYATLRIYHPFLEPSSVARQLGLQPTDYQKAGEADDPTDPGSGVYDIGGWFLETTSVVSSRDVRRHIQWLLDQIEPQREELARLQTAGYEMDVFCYWLSASGHGGPTLDPLIMMRLANVGLEVGFDVYFVLD